jgi:acyl dehydratase
MAVTVLDGVEGLKAAVGRHLGHSDWHEITQDQVNRFADVTGDHQWIHVDIERAATGPFGGPIAHGYLTLALLPMLLGEIVEVRDVALVVNAGIDTLRFRQPVPVGAKVRAGAEVKTAREAPGGLLHTVLKVTVEIEGQRKPAATAEVVFLYRGA